MGGLEPDLLDMAGVVRPRTGPAGVSRAGGVQGVAPDAGVVRPPAQPAPAFGFAGRPEGAPQGGPLTLPTAPPGGTQTGQAPTMPQQARPEQQVPPGQQQTPTPGAIQISIPQGGVDSGIKTPGGPAPVAGPGAGSDAMTPAAVQFPGIPRRRDVAGLPPGTQAMTPYGPVVTGPDGEASVQLTPEGKILWAQEKEGLRSRFGMYPLAGDPNAPQPDLTPGRLFYNPFTGEYGS